MAPRRIQRKRTKGWRMPEGAVYVGRGSRWGNPCRVERPSQRLDAVAWFETHVAPALDVADLRGKDLACWCPVISRGAYVPCHADVLLSLANDIPIDEVIRENTRRAKGEAVR